MLQVQSHPNQVLKISFHSIFLNGADNSFHNMDQLPAINLLCFTKQLNDAIHGGRNLTVFSLRQYLADEAQMHSDCIEIK